jgi:hypothetical protein
MASLDDFKDDIEQLYIVERRTLSDVMAQMEIYGMRASYV